jgi:hypothetical protein
MTIISATTVVPTAAVVSATSVKAMEPGTGTDEDAANEVVRAVVSVRRTSVRVITIVAVSAGRAGTNVARANADIDALCVRGNCQGKRENCQ